MKLIKGKLVKAQKVVIYGPEGIGKSTFALSFPDPIVIDVEGSTTNFEATRFENPQSWTMLMQQIDYVIKERPCKTLIIDTVDYVEQNLCKPHLIATVPHSKGYKVKNIEDYGYGSGYTHLQELWGGLLNKLQDVIEAGINVVLCGHAQLRKFEQPDELGAYDRWELKLERRNAAITKEWADMVLFANYKTHVVIADNDKRKAQGGKRVIYTTHHPAWDAKNRHNLPEEMSLNYDEIKHIIERDLEVKETKTETVVEEKEKQIATEDRYYYHPESNSYFILKKGEEIPYDSIDFQVSNEVTKEEYEKETQEKEKGPNLETNPAGLNYAEDPKREPTKSRALNELMIANNVTEEEVKKAVSEKGYYPYEMEINDYADEFIVGVLVGAWEQVFQIIKNNRGE